MEHERGRHVRYVRPNEYLVKNGAGYLERAKKVELGAFGVVNGVGQVRLSPDGFLRYYPVVYVNMARPEGDVSTYVFWADELEPVRAVYTVEQASGSAEPLGILSWVVYDTRTHWVIRDTRLQALVRQADRLTSPSLRWDSYEDAQAVADHWNWCPRHLAPKAERDGRIRMCSQHNSRVCFSCMQEFEE